MASRTCLPPGPLSLPYRRRLLLMHQREEPNLLKPETPKETESWPEIVWDFPAPKPPSLMIPHFLSSDDVHPFTLESYLTDLQMRRMRIYRSRGCRTVNPQVAMEKRVASQEQPKVMCRFYQTHHDRFDDGGNQPSPSPSTWLSRESEDIWF